MRRGPASTPFDPTPVCMKPHMRSVLQCVAALCGAATLAHAMAALPDAQAAAGGASRPNIVFILIDDAGFSDFGAYGSEIATPVIDSLAQGGVRFTNFHTASTCEASRAMLQSGVDNHRAGAGTLLVAIAENQKGKPGYEGYLSDNAHSLGQLMRDGGYATYYAGKWNLGNGVERSPGARGWDRYIGLEQTGADNFEAKVYAPLNMEAVWWEDGKRAVLPKDFYSTTHYVDKAIQYIDEGRPSGKPFFAMIALQAVHSPLQAPKADIDKTLGRYDEGWEKVRDARYRRQVEMGLMPSGMTLPKAPGAKAWASLSDSERREAAKKMSVFAAMLSNADQQIGRLREHLRQTGQLDDTVFIVMSDNGADPFELSKLNLPFRLWYRLNYALGVDDLGGKGSYVHYTQDWAEVSNTPFALFKGNAREGGMRVPFIVHWPARIQGGRITDQFAYVTDFLPTVLDIAGIALPGDEYRGKALHRPTGTSLLPYLEGKADAVHEPTQVTGFESTGGFAIFRGDFKLVRDGPPFSDGAWHLYNLRQDPTESRDLATSEPALFNELKAEVDKFIAANGVVLPEPGYNGIRQVLTNNAPILLRQMWPILAGALLMVGLLLYAVVASLLRARRRRAAGRGQ